LRHRGGCGYVEQLFRHCTFTQQVNGGHHAILIRDLLVNAVTTPLSRGAKIPLLFGKRRCHFCGAWVQKGGIENQNYRESRVCETCGSNNRMDALAQVLLRTYGHRASSLDHSLHYFSDLRIHEFTFQGPLFDRLSRLGQFTFSEFYPGVGNGELSASGVRCEDIENLTFSDNTFDLVVAQDVLEHVPHPRRGLSEVYRTLVPGGRHIFTVPFDRLVEASVVRTLLKEGALTYLLPPEYHGDPIRDEGALVFTDFGIDIVDLIASVGFQVELFTLQNPGKPNGFVAVFVATKPG
jgi:SAM-dependent methyltransferase